MRPRHRSLRHCLIPAVCSLGADHTELASQTLKLGPIGSCSCLGGLDGRASVCAIVVFRV